MSETVVKDETGALVPEAIAYPAPIKAWGMVILLLLIYTCSFVDRTIMNLLIKDIQADFDLNDTQFGYLTGIAFGLCYAVFGLIFSRFADSKSRKGIIAIGLVLWSLATAFSAFARNFTQLFMMRMGVGVGEAALAPAASSMIADSFPRHKLGLALSIYTTGVTLGMGFAYLFGGYVIEWSLMLPEIPSFGGEMMANWQKVFLLVGLPGFLLAILIMMVKEPTRKGLLKPSTDKKLGVSLAVLGTQFMRYKWAYIGVILGLTLAALLSFGIIAFLTKFIEAKHGIGPAAMGQTYGLIVMVTGTSGLLLGGTICDKMQAAGRKDSAIFTMMLAPLGYLIPSLLFPIVSDSTTMWIIIGVHTLFINLSTGVGYAAINLLTPNEMRGQFTALFVMMVGLAGAAMGPVAVGAINVEIYGGEALTLGQSFMWVSAISTPIAILLLLVGRKDFIRAQNDQQP